MSKQEITKKIIDAGLTRYYPVVVLRDESAPDVESTSEVILDRKDYSDMRLKEGLTDQEIFNFALTGMIAG
jgi:hypothetical protein